MWRKLFLSFVVISFTQVVLSEKCAEPGLQCSSDCKSMIFCPDKTGDSTTVQVCANNTTCHLDPQDHPSCEQNQKCFPKPGHNPVPFECSNIGRFPDVTTCDRYYWCAGTGVKPGLECVCKEGEHLDLSSFTCSDSPVIPCSPVSCSYLGECGDLQIGSTYHYICLEKSNYIVPFVFECPGTVDENSCTCPTAGDYIDTFSSEPACVLYNFNTTTAVTTTGTTGPTSTITDSTLTTPDTTSTTADSTLTTADTTLTTDSTLTTTDSTLTTTDSTLTTTDSTLTTTDSTLTTTDSTLTTTDSTTEGTTTEPTPTCIYIGQRFPAPNCRQFYECSQNLIPILKTCSLGFYFEIKFNGCTPGQC